MKIKVGTRGSRLALCQTKSIIRRLKQKHPEHEYEPVIIRTKGDQIPNIALKKIGDKGLFVREIETQLLEGNIDFAVHSMKDMPSELPPDLIFSQCPEREDPRDVLITRNGLGLADLRHGARIGTGSSRRAVQLKSLRPDLVPVDIRGNLDTRLEKLQTLDYDGIILAAAGLKRLGMESVITEYFSPEHMVSACAQGALAIELRKDNLGMLSILNELGNQETDLCVTGERAFLKSVNGSCHIPVGAYCTMENEKYKIYAIYGQENSESCVRIMLTGRNPIKLGIAAAEELQKQMELVQKNPSSYGKAEQKGGDK